MERNQRKPRGSRFFAYFAAAVVHLAIIGLVVFNISTNHTKVTPMMAEKVDVVNARAIDESEIKKQLQNIKEKERKKQREKEREQQRLKELQKKAEQEKQRIEDLKKQQELEKLKAQELEEQRKAIALKKKKEEEQEKKRKAEAEKKRKAEAERKRKEKIKKEKLEKERLAQEQRDREAREERERMMQMEEAAMAERRAQQRTATLTSQYGARIKRLIQSKTTISPDYSSNLKVVVIVNLKSSGDVISCRIIKSSGNPSFDSAVETAVYASSPLPIPSIQEDERAHKEFLKSLELTFTP